LAANCRFTVDAGCACLAKERTVNGDGFHSDTLAPQAERTCQQTQPVNWRKRRICRRRGPSEAPCTGGQRVAPRSTENRKNRNTFQMFGIRVRFLDDAMLSTKVPCKLEVEVVAPGNHGFQPPLRYAFVGNLPTARDNEAAAGVVRAAKKILRRKGRLTNPLDHLRPTLFAVNGFLFRRTVLKLFLASDAQRRTRYRLKPRPPFP